MSAFVRAITLPAFAVALGACAIMPDLPPDTALPARDILLHSACELQTALGSLDGRTDPKRFDARNWSIRISLNPKIDADIIPGAGLTRRQPTQIGVARFANWVVGGSSGIQLDMKGQRTGNLDFVFDSSDLIDNNQLRCDLETFSAHALTKKIGIADWLYRSVDAAYATGSSIDKPSFSSDVFMKFNIGTNSYTYTFTAGTDLLTLGGYYQVQETLNINFTAKPKVSKFNIVTLPKGGPGFDNNKALVQSKAAISTETRSDLQQIEQAIRNLRPAVQQ